jgi:asparagine synthase (glutamine-hydrolysing)
MCGIAGGAFWDGTIDRSAAESAVAAMVAAVEHRGPDGRGLCTAATPAASRHAGPLVVLGHTRLAILDVTDAGAQPMTGLPGTPWITYNGETYNFAALRAELERAGAAFSSRTDTEVLLRGYDAWGIGLLPRLRGMFAFALWDPQAQRLLLARDRLGIKPLYYYQGDRFLLFASEVRALLATGLVPRRLDATALWHYLGYQSVPAPRTLVNDVRALEPGTWMAIDADGRRTQAAYWSMLGGADAPEKVPADEGRRRVGELLRDAVDAHMVSDVPVGAFLSGGIDSSAIVALMREAGHQPRTFSIGFAERAFDETVYARQIASTFRTEHTHIELGDGDLLNQLPAALRAMDQPTGDGINTYIISRAVRAQGITVALSGLGGDELFGGYPSFSRLQRVVDIARLWARWPAPIRAAAAATVRTLGQSSIAASKAAAVMETDGSLASMFPLTRRVLSTEQRLALLSDDVLARIGEHRDPYDELLADAYALAPHAGFFARVSFAEARTYMHDVLLRDTDQMSMAHALEIRVPLLDHRLVEYVTSLPDEQKQANGTPKRLLVESLDGLLPADIVHRPKQGFTLPFAPWMRGALRPLCEEHLGERGLTGRGLVRPAEMRRLWKSFLDGSSDVSWSRLWTLVVLDAWLQEHPLETS